MISITLLIDVFILPTFLKLFATLYHFLELSPLFRSCFLSMVAILTWLGQGQEVYLGRCVQANMSNIAGILIEYTSYS